MPTWSQISTESLAAAKRLRDARLFRSSVSRAYYSAYAAATGALCGRATVSGAGRANPGHEQVVELVRHNLDPRRFSDWQRQRLAGALRTLRRNRLSADYEPSSSITEATAVESLREAAAVYAQLADQERR